MTRRSRWLDTVNLEENRHIEVSSPRIGSRLAAWIASAEAA